VKSECRYLDYRSTALFSSLVLDYLDQHSALEPFIEHAPTLDGMRSAMEARKKFPTHRALIRSTFEQAYAGQSTAEQARNIEWLSAETTFTVCTAHQPNIFTGYLYFIYKTAHTIALCRSLKAAFPENDFVPVFYIGSEDNDLDELSVFQLNGKPFRWETDQTGAVGRMQSDAGIQQLIEEIRKEVSHFPYAQQLIDLLKKAYAKGNTMADAIFILLNEMFGAEGLLVLQPDDAALKQSFVAVMKDDLVHSRAERIVGQSIEALSRQYKVQVNPRTVNLFYLRDGIRNRIDKRGEQYSVDGTVIRFQQSEILQELKEHPERFSPNVILRGLYQETILPNIAFIGGGSEVAYWMELRSLFEHYGVPYPVLVLRNSFLVVDAAHWSKLEALGIHEADLFKDETIVANEVIQRWAVADIHLSKETAESRALFEHLKQRAGAIDRTLVQHVHALEVGFLKRMESLEKKMLRAERKKQSTQLQRIWKLKSALFPQGSLQERKWNVLPYYAQYGPAFIHTILRHSLALEQQFGIVIIEE